VFKKKKKKPQPEGDKIGVAIVIGLARLPRRFWRWWMGADEEPERRVAS
jgi:hypothetical protein